MTITDYSQELNERIYQYLRANVAHYCIDSFILKFSLAVEPLKTILDTPLVVQDGPESFKAREQMESSHDKFYLNRINRYLDELEA